MPPGAISLISLHADKRHPNNITYTIECKQKREKVVDDAWKGERDEGFSAGLEVFIPF